MNSLFLHVITLICVPVGHIWKLDLAKRKRLDLEFWGEMQFFKNSNRACHAQVSCDN